MPRPQGSNADEWHLYLCERLDNRANGTGNELSYVAVQIAEAIDEAAESEPEWCKVRQKTADEIMVQLAARNSEMFAEVPSADALTQARLWIGEPTLQQRLARMFDAFAARKVAEAVNERDELIAALRGVVRVADRRTDEFDRARAALAKAEAP